MACVENAHPRPLRLDLEVQHRDEPVWQTVSTENPVQLAAKIGEGVVVRRDGTQRRLELRHVKGCGKAFPGNVTEHYPEGVLPDRNVIDEVAAYVIGRARVDPRVPPTKLRVVFGHQGKLHGPSRLELVLRQQL